MEIDWQALAGEAITQMLRIFLPVCIALILKWAGELWLKIKEARPDLAEVISIAAELGYSTAEDYFRDKDGTGEDKMEYAIKHAEAYIKETTGVSVDLDLIRDAITNYGVAWGKFTWTKDNGNIASPES